MRTAFAPATADAGCNVTQSPEATALLMAAQPDLNTAEAASFHAVLAQCGDWTWLVEQALAHGVGALLCRHLARAPAGIVPEDIRANAGPYLQARRAATEAAITQLVQLVDGLQQARVSALPIKGLTLGAQAYGDPTLRVSQDLDLLIPPDAIAPTMRVLGAFGYRSRNGDLSSRRLQDYYRYNGQDALFADDRLPVEPHWALAPRTLSMALDTAALWTRAGKVALHDRTLPCLSPEDAMLVACLHGGKEQWVRLLWIADVAALLRRYPGLDWAAIEHRAVSAGLHRMVLLGVRLAVDLLGAPAPDAIRAAAMTDPAVRRLAGRVQHRLFAGPVATPSVFRASLFRWQMRERWSDRLRYATRTLLTARTAHFRSVDLPDALAFLYPAVRIGHDALALPLWKGLQRLRP